MTQIGPIIVTGANAGIGKAMVAQLALQRRHVVMISRSLERGQAALEDIKASLPDECPPIDLVQGDLSSIASTQKLADTLIHQYPTASCLINNAGVWMTRRELTEDGLERTFMVNHLAPFILSRRLYPTLREHGPARIVNVNAGLYIKGHFAPEQTPRGEDFHAIKTYANTKLWGVLSTLEMARRIEGSGVVINAIHPGVIRTGLGHTTGPLGWLMGFIKLFWRKPAAGADSPVWLATAPEHAATHGQYFNEREPMALADNAKDPDAIRRCWEISEALVPGLPPLNPAG